MTSQNENNLNYYNKIISICHSCSLYLESDDMCLIEDKKVLDIVSSEQPVCPIGDW